MFRAAVALFKIYPGGRAARARVLRVGTDGARPVAQPTLPCYMLYVVLVDNGSAPFGGLCGLKLVPILFTLVLHQIFLSFFPFFVPSPFPSFNPALLI